MSQYFRYCEMLTSGRTSWTSDTGATLRERRSAKTTPRTRRDDQKVRHRRQV